MKKFVIENENLCSYIESLNYEVQARKELLSFMVQQGTKITDKSFVDYHEEYKEFVVQYEVAKSQLEKEFIQPLLKDGEQVTWNLDFATREVTIEGID